MSIQKPEKSRAFFVDSFRYTSNDVLRRGKSFWYKAPAPRVRRRLTRFLKKAWQRLLLRAPALLHNLKPEKPRAFLVDSFRYTSNDVLRRGKSFWYKARTQGQGEGLLPVSRAAPSDETQYWNFFRCVRRPRLLWREDTP